MQNIKKYLKPLLSPPYHFIKRMIWTRRRNSAFTKYIASHKNPKIHIGCGCQVRPNWFNVDFHPFFKGAYYIDVTKPLPFPRATFVRAFSEHMIEHITFTQAQFFLQELFRVMKPGGRVRIATPNLKTLALLYVEPKNEEQEKYIRTVIDNYNPSAGAYLEGFVINQLFEFGHRFLYDKKTLSFILEKAGFVQIEEFTSDRTGDDEFRGMDAHANDYIRYETLVLEAIKPNIKKTA